MSEKSKTTPQRVVQFRASDGSMHDTYGAALKHDHSLEFGQWLDEWLYEHCDHEVPDGQELAEAIKQEWSVSRRKGK